MRFPHHFAKAALPNTTSEIRFQHTDLGENIRIQSITPLEFKGLPHGHQTRTEQRNPIASSWYEISSAHCVHILKNLTSDLLLSDCDCGPTPWLFHKLCFLGSRICVFYSELAAAPYAYLYVPITRENLSSRQKATCLF